MKQLVFTSALSLVSSHQLYSSATALDVSLVPKDQHQNILFNKLVRNSTAKRLILSPNLCYFTAITSSALCS